MQKIRPSNENEMVYEFLKMELSSNRFMKEIENILNELNLNKDIIIKGDLDSEVENVLRIEILGRFRGYRKNTELFKCFPIKIDWVWTIFEKDDLSKIKYINYSYWNEISNYTGSPIEAAKTIRLGKTIYNVSNDNFVEISQKLKNGIKFPPLIFLTNNSESDYIILEGHARMTGYGLNPELFQNVSVLLGYCDSKELDKWYGKMPNVPQIKK